MRSMLLQQDVPHNFKQSSALSQILLNLFHTPIKSSGGTLTNGTHGPHMAHCRLSWLNNGAVAQHASKSLCILLS